MIDTSWMLDRSAPKEYNPKRRTDRLLVALCVIALFLIAAAVYSFLSRPSVTGDTNRDGRVNAVDLTQMKRHLIGTYDLSPDAITRGDANGNGRIDQADINHWRDQILGK